MMKYKGLILTPFGIGLSSKLHVNYYFYKFHPKSWLHFHPCKMWVPSPFNVCVFKTHCDYGHVGTLKSQENLFSSNLICWLFNDGMRAWMTSLLLLIISLSEAVDKAVKYAMLKYYHTLVKTGQLKNGRVKMLLRRGTNVFQTTQFSLHHFIQRLSKKH